MPAPTRQHGSLDVATGVTTTFESGSTLALAAGSTISGAPIVFSATMDIVSANAATAYFRLPSGASSAVIQSIDTILLGGAINGDVTITAAISNNGTSWTAVTNGVVTIATASSAAGDLDTATPTAARTLAAGNVLRLTVGGSNTTTSRTAAVSVYLR